MCSAKISLPCASSVMIGSSGSKYINIRSQNCYGWATGVNDYRQPGKGLNSVYELNVNSVRSKITNDLGQPMNNPNVKSPEGMHKIEVYAYPDIDPNNVRLRPDGKFDWDYHVWKEDSDGYWSHKPGETEIKRFDNSGSYITDVDNANRGRYTEYVGTWLIPD